MKLKKAFTLIELLVVIAILAVLAAAVVLVLNPAEMVKGARDTTRLADLNNINKAFTLLQGDVANASYGSSSVIYTSLPDTSPTCVNLGLPTLPTGWSYNCVSSSTLTKANGTGWIPVDFTQFSAGSILSKLPIDPVNATSSNLYYTYIKGSWKLSAGLESQKQKTTTGIQDKGTDANRFEIGSETACGGITTDYEGNLYPTVQIGTQCWMGANLKTKYKPDGTLMTNSIAGNVVTHSERSCPGVSGGTTPGTEADCATDGALYEWAAAMNGTTTEGAQGICPTGWHVPSDAEWKTTEMTLGMSQAEADGTNWRGTHSEGNQLKLAANCTGGTSCGTSGFNGVLTAGYRKPDGATFNGQPNNAYIWSSSLVAGVVAWNRSLSSGYATVYRTTLDRTYGFSVRCLKN
jgi:uncharacterized protein (TIGR02145 family)/prepilin-type N-terminal cleavage/methylation domain-containing protein